MTLVLGLMLLLAPLGLRFVFFVNADIFLGALGLSRASREAKRVTPLEWACGTLWAIAGIALLVDIAPRPLFVGLWVCGIVSHLTVLMWRATSKR